MSKEEKGTAEKLEKKRKMFPKSTASGRENKWGEMQYEEEIRIPGHREAQRAFSTRAGIAELMTTWAHTPSCRTASRDTLFSRVRAGGGECVGHG